MVALYPNLITTTATLQLETFIVALSLATMLALLPSATRDDATRGSRRGDESAAISYP